MKYGLLLDLNLLPTNFIECLCSHIIKEGKREKLIHFHCALHSLESLTSFPCFSYQKFVGLHFEEGGIIREFQKKLE